jgi:hypothetical protein
MRQYFADCGHTRYDGRGINIMKWLLRSNIVRLRLEY